MVAGLLDSGWITQAEGWSALAALLLLEIVLGVDNVVFISILANKLPGEQQARARRTGLLLAGGMRVLFLLGIGVILGLKKTLFEVAGVEFSGKSLVLLLGGLFLIFKAVKEIHHRLEGVDHAHGATATTTFGAVIVQVLLLDLVFSIDSVITAVGMTSYVQVMVIAVLLSVGVMLGASKFIYAFVNRHPTVKMLALSFLLLIGMTLIAEGLDQKIPKGYVYFSMAFALLVEVLNIRSRRPAAPVQLHEAAIPGEARRSTSG
jgi:predicted tellurium resistance membrane protein TerC